MRKALTLLLAVPLFQIMAVPAMAQEPPAFIIAKITITDPDRYSQEYGARFGGVFEQYEGEFVALSEDITVLEGEWAATRTAIIRFPSRAAALEWYKSDAYQELVDIRQTASIGDVILIDGR